MWGLNVLSSVEVAGIYSYHCAVRLCLPSILAGSKMSFPRSVLQAVDTRGASVYLTQSGEGGESLFPIRQSTPAVSNKALYSNTK